MLELFEPYKSLFLQLSLSLSLTLLLVFLRIPVFLLHGLHTYIHPDNPNNGVRAAIRRPDAPPDSDPAAKPSELRRRTKSKDKDKFQFDESNAQIFRLKLDEAHLRSRLYFDQYSHSFTISFLAIASLILHSYLSTGSEKKNPGVLNSGILIPASLGFVGVFKVLASLVKISFEKSASRRSEKLLSVGFGVSGLVLGVLIVHGIAIPVLDFDLGSIDGFGRFSIIVLTGCLAGLVFVPSTKIARSFWLGTDQIRSNLSMITCGWLSRMILYANYLTITFTALLWIKPFSEMFVVKGTPKSVSAARLLGNVGFSPSDFANLRIWGLLLSGMVQVLALRPNLQMYLNEALLSWYQRLHASKVPDLDFSRAKVFLHNHYLCLVVVQFLALPLLVLIFLGLSQVDFDGLGGYESVCGFLPCSAFSREAALFMAWWVTFLSAVYTSATIALFRRGDLRIS